LSKKSNALRLDADPTPSFTDAVIHHKMDFLNTFLSARLAIFTGALSAAVWGTYVGFLARAHMPPTPAVGIGLSGGGLVGLVQHTCALDALDKFSPSLTDAGANLAFSVISAGSDATNIYANSPLLWVPQVDGAEDLTLADLSALPVPAGRRGITKAGGLFDLGQVAGCVSCLFSRAPAPTGEDAFQCDFCKAFGDGFLKCMADGRPLWDCFTTLFAYYYGYDIAESTSGPWSVIIGVSLFNQPERQNADVDGGGVPVSPTPGFIDNSAILFTHVPPNKGYGSVEVSNGNFKMLGQGVRTLGPLFRTTSYNAELLASISASTSFLGMTYHFNDANGETCQSELDSLVGLETGSAASLALQTYYLSQMRLIGSWEEGLFATLFQTLRQRTGLITDGGAVDTFGAAGLLRQRIPTIVLVMNGAFAYNRVTSPGYLFGQNPWFASDSPCYRSFWYRLPNNTLQVFDESLWPQVDAALRNGSGTNSIKLTGVEVKANPYFGIQAYTLDTLSSSGRRCSTRSPRGWVTGTPSRPASCRAGRASLALSCRSLTSPPCACTRSTRSR